MPQARKVKVVKVVVLVQRHVMQKRAKLKVANLDLHYKMENVNFIKNIEVREIIQYICQPEHIKLRWQVPVVVEVVIGDAVHWDII